MQFLVVLTLCFNGLLMGGVAGDALSDIDAQITKLTTDLENQLVQGCKTLGNAEAAAGVAFQNAIATTIKNSGGSNKGGALVGGIDSAVTKFLAAVIKNDRDALDMLGAIFNSIIGAIESNTKNLYAAFDAAHFTPAQQSAWVKEHAAKYQAIQVNGDKQCTAELTKAKTSLDASNAEIQKAISGIKDPANLAAKVTKLVTLAILAGKTAIDNDMGVVTLNENLFAISNSMLDPVN